MANTIARFQTAVNAEHLKSPASRGKPNHLEVTVAHDHRGNGVSGATKHKAIALNCFKKCTLTLFPVAEAVGRKHEATTNSMGSQLLGVQAGLDIYTMHNILHATGITSSTGDVAAKTATDEEWLVPYWCVRSTSEDKEANM